MTREAVAFSLILMSCAHKRSEDKLNNEAIILHNSMVKKATRIENRLRELKKDSSVNQDSVTVLIESLEQWENDLVEAPGNENHGHGGHPHYEHTTVDVTPEQMLEIQRGLDVRLSAIGKRATQLKPHNEDDHEH